MSHVRCHVSRVTCHVSYVMCHMSRVRCNFLFFFEKEVKLVGGGSFINGATPSSLISGKFDPMTTCCCRTPYWDNVWKSQGGIMVNGVPREVPRPKPEGPQRRGEYSAWQTL